MLGKCGKDSGYKMTFPLSDEKILVFISWLLSRGLSASTINSYLSGIRQAHISAGVFLPSLRSPMVNQILQGATNIDAVKKRYHTKPKRLPVTLTILKLLKAELKASSLEKEDKLLIWAVALIAFMGAFRIHELLSRRSSSFDPHYDLLGRDINIKSIKVGKASIKTIIIKLKSEKTDRIGRETIVDVYGNEGPFCPVRALEKWKKASNLFSHNLPAFRLSSGHSFRSGIASLMGTLGYSEEQIMALGRWSSNAFNMYLKLPRTRRLQMAKTLGNLKL